MRRVFCFLAMIVTLDMATGGEVPRELMDAAQAFRLDQGVRFDLVGSERLNGRITPLKAYLYLWERTADAAETSSGRWARRAVADGRRLWRYDYLQNAYSVLATEIGADDGTGVYTKDFLKSILGSARGPLVRMIRFYNGLASGRFEPWLDQGRTVVLTPNNADQLSEWTRDPFFEREFRPNENTCYVVTHEGNPVSKCIVWKLSGRWDAATGKYNDLRLDRAIYCESSGGRNPMITEWTMTVGTGWPGEGYFVFAPPRGARAFGPPAKGGGQ